MVGQRLATLRELADVLGVVEGLDMLPRASDGDAVQQLEEIKFQRIQNGARGTLLGRKL